MRKIPLVIRVLIAIVLGIVFGLFLPEPAVRIFTTFNGIFSNLLGFIIPLLIVGLIVPAIAELGKGAGKLLVATTAVACASTFIAGFFSWGVSMAIFPTMLAGSDVTSLADPEQGLATPFFEIEIPPMFAIMTALTFAFVFGIALTALNLPTLQSVFVDFRKVIVLFIEKVIVPLLPVFIFGIFLNMTFAGQVWAILSAFLGVTLVVIGMTLVFIVAWFLIGGAIGGHNPFTLLKNMLPAYATALGTSSSAATIPVTLRCAIKAGISEPIASFVIPLCATIHLAGSTIKITGFSLAVMILFGIEINPLVFVGFIFMLGITMVAAPGVPGGAIYAASGLLATMLGFSDAQVGLMIATYIAIDSVGTATNVTCDGGIAAIMDRFAKGRDAKEPGWSPDQEPTGEREPLAVS